MTKSRLRAILLAAVVCLWCHDASAEIFTVGSSLTDGTYMGLGTSLSGSFDLNSVIPADGRFNAPYDVISAEYTFYFQDDGDLEFQDVTHGPRDTLGRFGSWPVYRHIYRQSHYYNNYDEYEHVQADIEGAQSSDGGSAYYSTEEFIRYEYSSYFNILHDYYYSRESGYTGPVTLTEVLGADALAGLAGDGILDFTLTATEGDLIYLGGQLTADVVPNPVPVPGAVLLGMIGLGVAGVKFRKRA